MPSKNPYSFWALNKKALLFQWIVSALIVTCLVAAIAIFNYLDDASNKPIAEEVPYWFLYIFGAICFILLVATLDRFWKHNSLKKSFSNPPFNLLDQIGFTDIVVGSRWSLFSAVKLCSFKGFPVIADTGQDKGWHLAFHFGIERIDLDNKEFDQLEKDLKSKGIHLILSDRVHIEFNSREPEVSTIEELEKELIRVAEALEAHGLRPYQTTDLGQDKLN